MAKFQISIDDDNLEELVRRLAGTENSDAKTTTAIVSEFAQIAFDEFEAWVNGRTRFRSLSELQIERVATIFARISPTEIPSTSRLYNDLGLSHGQATYVARVLADRQLSTWRETARTQLTVAMLDKLAKAKENLDDGRGEAEIQLTISRLAFRELELLFEGAFSSDPLIAPPKRVTAVGDLQYVGMESATLVSIVKHTGLDTE